MTEATKPLNTQRKNKRLKTRRSNLFLKVKQKIKNSLKALETASGLLQAIPGGPAQTPSKSIQLPAFSIHSPMHFLTSNHAFCFSFFLQYLSTFPFCLGLDDYNEFTLSAGIFKSRKFNNMLSLGFIFP